MQYQEPQEPRAREVSPAPSSGARRVRMSIIIGGVIAFVIGALYLVYLFGIDEETREAIDEQNPFTLEPRDEIQRLEDDPAMVDFVNSVFPPDEEMTEEERAQRADFINRQELLMNIPLDPTEDPEYDPDIDFADLTQEEREALFAGEVSTEELRERLKARANGE